MVLHPRMSLKTLLNKWVRQQHYDTSAAHMPSLLWCATVLAEPVKSLQFAARLVLKTQLDLIASHVCFTCLFFFPLFVSVGLAFVVFP